MTATRLSKPDTKAGRLQLAVLDLLRQQMPQSILWRQRLPVAGAAAAADDEQLRAELRQQLSQLDKDLTSILNSESFLTQLLSYMRSAYNPK